MKTNIPSTAEEFAADFVQSQKSITLKLNAYEISNLLRVMNEYRPILDTGDWYRQILGKIEYELQEQTYKEPPLRGEEIAMNIAKHGNIIYHKLEDLLK
jgi:hypothetical protein